MSVVMPKPPSEHAERIARNLARFREELGISQPKMASAVGVPANTWIAWEKGRRIPKGDMLYRIADALDRSSDDLAAESPPPAVNPLAPCFGLAVISDEAPPDLVRRASAMVRDLNREYRKIAADRAAAPGPSQADRNEAAARVAQQLAATVGARSRVAKHGPASTPKRSK